MNVMNPRDYLTQIQVKEQQFYFSIVKAEFEDTEGVIRIRKSKKNRHNHTSEENLLNLIYPDNLLEDSNHIGGEDRIPIF
jgi:adenylate cyclase class IV